MNLPVGYYTFHRNKFINYQLNRWHSLGYAQKSEIEQIGQNIKTFDDYVRLFQDASSKALKEGRLKNAATYLRASEFLVEPKSREKVDVYREFIKLFDQAFENEGIERHRIPYSNGSMSCLYLKHSGAKSKGVILGCGGFDSFIEEFYCVWKYFAELGYDVIAFEGPGQGGTLRTGGLPFNHDWEKPTAAVLDYFKVEKATAIGVSMGGYWMLRAAAFEKRIDKVVAWSPVYDWLEMTNAFNRKMAKWLLKHPGLLNFLVRMKMAVPILKHSVKQAMYIQGKHRPADAVSWMLGMNKEHIHSHLVNQDVLLLAGEHDAFQPPILLEKQKDALVNARSISSRVFTKSEHADQHCQMGNVGLPLKVIGDWLNGF